ncbi:hypothetical protein [Anoxybacter fermentans]|nr:hypothetical protein [Anoxybacter fermentans]
MEADLALVKKVLKEFIWLLSFHLRRRVKENRESCKKLKRRGLFFQAFFIKFTNCLFNTYSERGMRKPEWGWIFLLGGEKVEETSL